MSRPTILVQYATQYKDLLAQLLRRLSAAGYDAVLLHQGKTFLPPAGTSQFSLDDFVAVHDLEDCLRARPAEQVGRPADLARRSAMIESRTGVKALEAVRADRHLAHGFVTGAVYAKSRYGVSTSHDQAIDIALRLTEYIEGVCQTYPVVAVIGYPGALDGSVLLQYARAAGLAIRIPTMSPAGRFYWAVDQQYRPLALEERYQAAVQVQGAVAAEDLTAGASEETRSIRAAEWIRSFRSTTTLGFLLHKVYRLTRREVGNHLKRRGQVYGLYLYRDLLEQVWGIWRLRRAALRDKPVFSTLPADLPFVFYPLSVEPESTLMAEAPECDNQLTVIDQVAKALPAGWRLIVKEHPGVVAPRPEGFWRQVRAYPNVIVAPMLESGEDYVSRAQAVAIIRSTMGLQAALAGVPVLTPQKEYFGTLLPHVFVARCTREIEEALRALQADRLPPKAERIRRARALKAVFDSGPEIVNASLIRGVSDGKAISEPFIDMIFDLFLTSLRSPVPCGEDPRAGAVAPLTEKI